MTHGRVVTVLGEVDLSPELRRHIALHEERLAQYRAIEERDFAARKPLSRAQQIQSMILKKGILYETGEVTWKRSKDSTVLDVSALTADHPELTQAYVKAKPGSRRFLVVA